MPLVSLQERLRAIATGFDVVIPNDGFRILAADNTENGLSIGAEEGQRPIDPLLSGVDLVILDNLSTLCTNGSESASDAWVPMQNWLLKLRRQGIAVLLVHHAGTNGRQRGTSRCEDALDTVIALRRPEDYSPEQGARFEVHFEKLRNRVDGDGALPFEAKLDATLTDETDVRWLDYDLGTPVLKQAAQLFKDGLSVREVAGTLRVSKTEAGRLRLRAVAGWIACVRPWRRPSPGEWPRSGIVNRRRSAFTHPGLKAIVAATRTCGQLCPNRQTLQKWDIWTPTGCFPRAIRRALVRRFRWRAPIRQPKNQRFCSQLFSAGRRAKTAGTEQTGCLPSDWEARRRDRIRGAPPSRKYATFKLGSNVAPICFRQLSS
jgi:AAA domain